MKLLEQLFLPFVLGNDSRPASTESPDTSGPPESRPGAKDRRHRTVALQGQTVAWELRRTRRKTVGMSIGQEGKIQVNAPRWVPVSDIESILQEKSRWLLARLAEWSQTEQQRLLPQQQWVDGASLPYLGKPMIMIVAPDNQETRWDDFRRELQLALPRDASVEQFRDAVHGWLQHQARVLFEARLTLISTSSGRAYTRFSLSNARGRWGSCTHDGHIRLNWRLIHFGEEVIDYVIAHELAHIRTMDHSRGFWDEVADILPTYQDGKTLLRRARLDTLPTY